MKILDEINKQLISMKFKNEKRTINNYIDKQILSSKDKKYSIVDFNIYDIIDPDNKEYPYFKPNITEDGYLKYKVDRKDLLIGLVNFNSFDIDYKVIVGRHEIYNGTIKSRHFNYGFCNKLFLPIMTLYFSEIYFLFKNNNQIISDTTDIRYDNNLRNIRFIYCYLNTDDRKLFFGTNLSTDKYFINKGILTKRPFSDEKYTDINFG